MGFMSGKLLLRLDAIKGTLVAHTPEHFPFLAQYANTRNRTIFYATLGRLLFMDDSRKNSTSLWLRLGIYRDRLAATDAHTFRTHEVKHTLIGLFRDLRGIASAANSRRTYGQLFDWMYPRHTGLLLRAMENFADDPQVSTPLLKFVAEFVLNKTQRLTFEPSSVNGILLFREISKLIVAYGQRIMQVPPPKPGSSEAYPLRFKGIWIALTVLMRALSGNYVNFGVFELYGDNALKMRSPWPYSCRCPCPWRRCSRTEKSPRATLRSSSAVPLAHGRRRRVRRTDFWTHREISGGGSEVSGRQHI